MDGPKRTVLKICALFLIWNPALAGPHPDSPVGTLNLEPVEAIEVIEPKQFEQVEPATPVVKEEPQPEPPPWPSGDWVERCKIWAEQAGVPLNQSAINLIGKESGCNPNAVNPYSGACGIGQQLPCGKWPHQWNDPIGGLKDMYNYVLARYGSWDSAWSFWLANNWY